MKTTMNVLLVVVCACGASARLSAPSAPPVKAHAHVDPEAAMSQFQGLMAAAQTSLAKAERHQEHAVKKARKNLTALLSAEALAFGKVVARYDMELSQSATELEILVNTTKATLDAAAAKAGNTWGEDAGMQERAQAGAQAQVTAGEVRKANRMHQQKVHEAVGDAERSLEDHLTSLSRKVGDVSDVLDKAKASLEAEVAKPSAAAASPVRSSNQSSNRTASQPANQTGNSTSQNLSALADNLKAARTDHRARVEKAEKELKNASAAIDKDLTTGIAKIEQTLNEKEQENIRKVRSGITTPPPQSAKVHAKTQQAPAKKTTAKDDAATKALVALLSGAFRKAK